MTELQRIAAVGKAKAFSLWVRSIIGSEPIVSVNPEYVAVEFTPEQRMLMVEYLDQQVGSMLTAGENGDLRIAFGDILVPWSMRYMVPLFAGLVLLGYGISQVSKMRLP